MKIDILKKPPENIFKDRKKYSHFFIFFLLLALCSIFLGMYAILSSTRYYENIETAALTLLVLSALVLTYFGEKLQAYKKLYPPHYKDLAALREKHPEIENYCRLVEAEGRRLIRAEYLACRRFAREWD